MSDVGLVLAGGSARGAYQAGVMRFVFCDLAKRLGRPLWPDLVSGTSVGAINCAFVVARHAALLERLAQMWRRLHIDQVFDLHWSGFLGAFRSAYRAETGFALLDPQPLYRLVEKHFPEKALRKAIDSGQTRALILSATDLESGYNVLFVDTADNSIPMKPAPGARAFAVNTAPIHILASAALPFLFPPVRCAGRLYLDGSLRQNTPLRPVLRAGASRVLVIGVKQTKEEEGQHPISRVTPNVPFLLGKTMNAVMLDPVERDLENAQQVNKLIRWGAERHGQAFADQMQREMGMRHVDVGYVRPSQDLGVIASEVYHSSPPKASRQIRWMLGFAADRANAPAAGESDLLSYVMFDRSYTAVIEELGYEDARAMEDELARLLAPTQ